MTLATAADFVKEGIRVNACNSGIADTPWVARLLDQTDDASTGEKALQAR